MKRSMMQVYVKSSNKAVELYQKAFDAKLISSDKNDDGTFYHAELDVYGQVLAIAESSDKNNNSVTGNTMQFCLHFGKGNEHIVHKSFDILKNGANILCPLAPCEFSPLMADFIDKFGVRWCIFV